MTTPHPRPNLDTLQMPWESCERCKGAMGRLLPSIATGNQIWSKCDGCNGTGKRLRWPAEVVLLAQACVAANGKRDRCQECERFNCPGSNKNGKCYCRYCGGTGTGTVPPYYALADMLEEKGWPELSEHFRSSEPHPRGCFVLELLTGGTTQ